MRISDWSSDVCSSDLHCRRRLCPRLCLLLGLFPCLGTILLQRLRKRLVDPLQGSLRVDEEVGRPDAQEAPTETLEDRLPHLIAIARRRRRVVGSAVALETHQVAPGPVRMDDTQIDAELGDADLGVK